MNEMADGQAQQLRSGFGRLVDAAVIARARRGDMAAFAQIYECYGSACYNLALRVLGEPAAAEDIVQEVFLKMFDAIAGYRGDAPFGAWLKRMAANATIDVTRQRARLSDRDIDSVLDSVVAESDAQGASDAWSLLMRLPERARAVVILHEVEGYTHKDLAHLFGQSESWSKSVLARSLERLHAAARTRKDEEVER